MLAAVGVVLLIAVVNVVNMSLARAATQRREVSLRMALGAGRWQLVRQQLAESSVLAVSGGLLGLMIAGMLVPTVLALNPEALPRGLEAPIHAGVLAFCAALVLLVTLGAALVPVLFAGSQRLTPSLAQGDGAGSRGSVSAMRVRKGLVIAEVALSLVLLVGAALLIKSLARTARVDTGFATQQLLTARIDLPISEYDTDAQVRFFEDLRARLAALPRVEAVGLSSRLPLSEGTSTSSFYIEGLGDVAPEELPAAHIRFVTPGFFAALQIPLLSGRVFDERDGVSEFGVIVDEQLAEQLWPGESALDKRIREGQDTPWIPVVGVVGNTRHWGQQYAPTQTLYVPFRMIPSPTMMIALRSEGAPTALAPTLREVVAEIDANLPISDLQSMEQRLASTLARPRFNTVLLTVFAAVAVTLGALGIYGTIAWSVAQRRGEIGVRMALGALRGDVRRLVVGQGLRLTLAGVAIGIPAALVASRLLESMLFQVEPGDPLTLATVVVVIGVVAVAASWFPALRATRVDPVTALRAD
jgi:predicted permease